MSKSIIISPQILTELYVFLHTEGYAGYAASPEDTHFIVDDNWLKDATIIDAVSRSQGIWEVRLVYAHHQNPLQLVVRKITCCYSEKKANTTAMYMREEAAKDKKDRSSVSVASLQLCAN